MQGRSIMPGRHIARAMCSTLPAHRSDRSRFALAEKQMYPRCARTLHALDLGSFGVDSAHATESTDLICVAMQWRRQPWRSHALGRLSGIAVFPTVPSTQAPTHSTHRCVRDFRIRTAHTGV